MWSGSASAAALQRGEAAEDPESHEAHQPSPLALLSLIEVSGGLLNLKDKLKVLVGRKTGTD